MPKRLLVLMLVLASMLAGCRSSSPPPEGALQVTRADSGKTINLNVGAALLLSLGEAPPEWEVSVDDERVLARVANISPVKGSQGVWKAKAPGTAHLRAVGIFPCQKQQPACKIASPVFDLTVVVQ